MGKVPKSSFYFYIQLIVYFRYRDLDVLHSRRSIRFRPGTGRSTSINRPSPFGIVWYRFKTNLQGFGAHFNTDYKIKTYKDFFKYNYKRKLN